jgi:hypothetical protein
MNLSQEIQSLQERLERGRSEDGVGSLYRLVAATPPPGLTLVARELQAAWARYEFSVLNSPINPFKMLNKCPI